MKNYIDRVTGGSTKVGSGEFWLGLPTLELSSYWSPFECHKMWRQGTCGWIISEWNLVDLAWSQKWTPRRFIGFKNRKNAYLLTLQLASAIQVMVPSHRCLWRPVASPLHGYICHISVGGQWSLVRLRRLSYRTNKKAFTVKKHGIHQI